MNNRSLTTPTSLAAPHIRLFAFLVDGFIVVQLCKILNQFSYPQGWDRLLFEQQLPNTFVAVVLASLILMALRDWWSFASVGKWVLGLGIRNATNLGATSLRQRLLRQITLPLLPLEAWFCLRDKHYQRLSDKLAHTVVVIEPQLRSRVWKLSFIAILFFTFILLAFFTPLYTIERSEAFQQAVQYVNNDYELLRLFGANPKIKNQTFQLDEAAKKVMIELAISGNNDQINLNLELQYSPQGWQVLPAPKSDIMPN